jgi:hypothetical protein
MPHTTETPERPRLLSGWVRLLAISITVVIVVTLVVMLVVTTRAPDAGPFDWTTRKMRSGSGANVHLNTAALWLALTCVGALRNSRAWAHAAGYTAVLMGLWGGWQAVSQGNPWMLPAAAVYLCFGVGVIRTLGTKSGPADA